MGCPTNRSTRPYKEGVGGSSPSTPTGSVEKPGQFTAREYRGDYQFHECPWADDFARCMLIHRCPESSGQDRRAKEWWSPSTRGVGSADKPSSPRFGSSSGPSYFSRCSPPVDDVVVFFAYGLRSHEVRVCEPAQRHPSGYSGSSYRQFLWRPGLLLPRVIRRGRLRGGVWVGFPWAYGAI